ncbi:prolipoprotein diacylglyceryl transferase [Adhaeribacter radiodurans]|uniref:Phosphatidylglycerol--prolipoprotein diacylglyceryl transferase n=1 Tax=Adhaeribacter radiodurans TaxID=2745197 RepID=A0A7L7LBB1_9BACT|nr:prolipoprotein diacylglyceryl transferase [Adhaeribacter radiodurans]QMU30110.1 prolipoprotein diacylglyceryl transferase [Adhaeribacter radiodurans]
MALNTILLWNPIVWNVSPEIFDFGFFALRWYGLLFALGFVFGQRILTRIYNAEGRTEQDVDVITLYMIIGTVLGARLGHCLFYEPEVYLKDPIRILKIWEGGLASHGATIGILLSLFLFSRKYKFDYLWVLDRIVIVVALGGSLIRLGNLFNSEIIGKPTDLPWAFKFERNHELINGVQASLQPRHPAQLYESISSFLLFLFLYSLWNRRKSLTPRGLLFGLFVVILFTLRFLYEFLKENQVDKEDFLLNTIGMNIGQLLSIPLIIIGLFILIRAITKPTYVDPVVSASK